MSALLSDPMSPYRPVALLDDKPTEAAQTHPAICGYPGGQRSRPGSCDQVVLPSSSSPIPSAGSEVPPGGNQEGRRGGPVPCSPAPVAQLFLTGDRDRGHPAVTTEDLLGRRPSTPASRRSPSTCRVAGGSSQARAEIYRLGAVPPDHPVLPADLIMLDRDESGLHQVQLSIEGKAMLDSRFLVVCEHSRRIGAQDGVSTSTVLKSCSTRQPSSTCRFSRCGRPRPKDQRLWDPEPHRGGKAGPGVEVINISTDKAGTRPVCSATQSDWPRPERPAGTEAGYVPERAVR